MNKRLSNDVILEIFNSLGTCKSLSIKYGLSKSYINGIKVGRKYSDITGKIYIKKSREKLLCSTIMQIYRSKDKQAYLAKKYNTNIGTISQIKCGKIYCSVTGAKYVKNQNKRQAILNRIGEEAINEIHKCKYVTFMAEKYKISVSIVFKIKSGKIYSEITQQK